MMTLKECEETLDGIFHIDAGWRDVEQRSFNAQEVWTKPTEGCQRWESWVRRSKYNQLLPFEEKA